MSELFGQLLERCKQGQGDAVGELVKRFGASAHALAMAILADEHLAQDAVQAAFVTALGRLGQLREANAFPGWFRQIVRTQAGRILRQRREAATGQTADPAASANDSPPVAAASRELRAIVRQAVRRLPPASQQTAELFYFEQRSLSQVADLLQVPPGTVKRRLHDARQRLRDMLLGYIEDGRMPPEEPTKPPWQLPL